MFELMGDRLRLLRSRLGISQAELADLVNKSRYKPGIKQSRISDLERLKGKELPSVPVLAALAITLETSTDYLLGLTDDDKPASDLEDQVLVTVSTPEEKAIFSELFELLRRRTPEDQRLVLDLVRKIVPKSPRVIGD